MLTALCLEDSPRDVEIIRELLIDAGFDLKMECTAAENEFVTLLRSRAYDFILADFKLPGFDAFAALRWTMEICPNVPFICVSGSIGEETAVEILKQGAVDYVLKDRLARLPSAIERALREAKERNARHRAEGALTTSEVRYRRLFEAARDGILILDANTGMVVDVNPFLMELLGFSHREFLGKKIWELGFFKDITESKANFLELQQKEYVRYENLPLKTGKGELINVEFVSNVYLVNHQKVVQCNIRDVTERKRSEEALEKSERRLREAQEMAHLGFWNWDVKTGEVEWSEEVFKIFCLDPKTFTPQIDSILALSPWPEDNHRDQELIKRAIETHSPGSYEQKFLRPDQSIGHYYSNFQGNYDEKGDLISIVGTVLDITERKQAEEKLRQRAEEVQTLMETTPAAIWVAHDPKCLHITGNKAANSFYEAADQENVSAGSTGVRHFFRSGKELSADELTMQQAVVTGQDVRDSELDVLLPSGKWITILGNATPLRDSSGTVRGCVGVFMDITERERAAEKILDQLEELRRWQEVTLGREDRNRQLKSEVNDLLIRLGETIRYPSQEDVSNKCETENG